MAKAAYIGIEGLARKVKAGYLGQEDICRKIKAAYVGIGGVARPCWAEGGPVYFGTVTPLPQAVQGLAGTVLGSHAIFAGGSYVSYNQYLSDAVSAYSPELTLTVATPLGTKRTQMAAATAADSYAIFAAGQNGTSTGVYTTVLDAYSPELVRSAPASLSTPHIPAGGSVGTYAVFAGGWYLNARGERQYTNTVTVYDANLTKSAATALNAARYEMGAARAGDLLVFAGGSESYYEYSCGTVEAYNSSLTKSFGEYISSRLTPVGVSLNGRAIFAGGSYFYGSSYDPQKTVEAFDGSLTKTLLPDMTTARRMHQGGVIGDKWALFCGGFSPDGLSLAVELYDAAFTKQESPLALQKMRSSAAAVGLGNCLLIAGGYSYQDYYECSMVEAITCD